MRKSTQNYVGFRGRFLLHLIFFFAPPPSAPRVFTAAGNSPGLGRETVNEAAPAPENATRRWCTFGAPTSSAQLELRVGMLVGVVEEALFVAPRPGRADIEYLLLRMAFERLRSQIPQPKGARAQRVSCGDPFPTGGAEPFPGRFRR